MPGGDIAGGLKPRESDALQTRVRPRPRTRAVAGDHIQRTDWRIQTSAGFSTERARYFILQRIAVVTGCMKFFTT